ncbi:MAG: hypothetical protein QOC99_2394 [Acidobacteriota bacterium]|nr:hypothetical protein [Acidobacteriota bacterium]
MSERCNNCGAELFAGQQFCRRCGTPVRAEGGEAPTQLLPEGAQQTSPKSTAAGTSPFSGARTDAVLQQPTAYTPPLAAFQQTSPLPSAPARAPRRRRRGAWLFALFAVFVLGGVVACAAAYVLWRARHPSMIVKRVSVGGMSAPQVPPVPPNLGDQIKDALKGAGVPLPVDESGASVTGTDTVLTQTYDMGEDATFSLQVVNGNVTITGADGEQAVVKITKHGGSPQERSGARVLASKTDEGLTLITAPAQSGAVSVSYEVQLPRGLRQIEISADKGDVHVSGFDGEVVADLKMGDVEFRDVSGKVRSRLIKGNTRIFYEKPEREGAQEFSVVKGNIEATIADGANADVKAETLDGDIDVDEAFQMKVEKAPAGHSVAGRLGDGGEHLMFKVTKGDIKLKK